LPINFMMPEAIFFIKSQVKSKIPPYQSVPMILYTNVPHLLQPK
jgi:hypothetical protein